MYWLGIRSFLISLPRFNTDNHPTGYNNSYNKHVHLVRSQNSQFLGRWRCCVCGGTLKTKHQTRAILLNHFIIFSDAYQPVLQISNLDIGLGIPLQNCVRSSMYHIEGRTRVLCTRGLTYKEGTNRGTAANFAWKTTNRFLLDKKAVPNENVGIPSAALAGNAAYDRLLYGLLTFRS